MPRSADAQRDYRRQRYAAYHQLCQERGVTPRGRKWLEHLQELTSGDGGASRLTRAEAIAFWREKFSDQELFEMAGAIDSLLSEDEDLREVA